MINTLKSLTVGAAMLAGISGAAMAQSPYYAPSNPVSGAVNGEMSGAARGNAVGGPVGAIVGGAIGTATGTIAGTTNALVGGPAVTYNGAPAYGSSMPPAPPPPACAPGYMFYSGACYPAH